MKISFGLAESRVEPNLSPIDLARNVPSLGARTIPLVDQASDVGLVT
jgi:hypothetical protein